MSAPGITYSGVLAKKAANKNVDENLDESVDAGVFGGLKFWVSARVSNRKSCVDTIQVWNPSISSLRDRELTHTS